MAAPEPTTPARVQAVNNFDDRNLFLDFLLGVISLSEQTVEIMAELGEDSQPETPRQPAPETRILR